jgi:hypothetical protein
MPPPPPVTAQENAAAASCLLGGFYALGLGTAKDMRAAAKWWYLPLAEYNRLLAAAGKGDIAAQVALGDLYMNSPCVMQIDADDNTAINNSGSLRRKMAEEWYDKAARAGDGQAAVKFAKLLNFGYDPKPPARDMAMEWFRKAAELGVAEGQYEYGLQLRRNGERREGLTWLRKAEAQGYAPAIKYLQEGRTNELHSDGRYEGVTVLLFMAALFCTVFMIRKKKPLADYMTWRLLTPVVSCIAVFALTIYCISQTPLLSRLFDRMFLLLMKSRAYMPDAVADNMYLFMTLFLIMLVAFVILLVVLVTVLVQLMDRALSTPGKPKPPA